MAQAFGIHKDGELYRVACISGRRGELSIDFVETLDAAEKLSSFLDQNVTTGVGSQDVLIRQIETPLKKRSDLKRTLPFKLESLIPYPLNEVNVKPLYISRGKETLATFYALPHEALSAHIESWREFGVDPIWVSSESQALYRYATFLDPSLTTFQIVHVGRSECQLVSISEGVIQAHTKIQVGQNDFVKALGVEREDQPNLRDIDAAALPDLSALVERFERELDRALHFHSTKGGGGEFLYAGESGNAQGIEALIRSYFPESGRKSGLEEGGYGPFAIPIGLALDNLKRDHHSLQFRTGALASERQMHRVKRRFGLALGCCFALTLFTYFSLNYMTEKRRGELVSHTDTFVELYAPHIDGVGKVKGSLEEKLQMLEKKLRLPKKGIKTYSITPSVQDLFSALSKHPLLDGIKIQGLTYELIDYPTLENPTHSYEAYVTLNLTAQDGQKVRAFHDALVEGDPLADCDEEITWNRKEEAYEIGFYLN